MRTLPTILCATLVGFLLGAHSLGAQVLFDEYHGVVSVPTWESHFRNAREHFADLRLRGYKAVVTTSTYLNPFDGKKDRISDTIDIVDEMRRLEGRTVHSCELYSGALITVQGKAIAIGEQISTSTYYSMLLTLSCRSKSVLERCYPLTRVSNELSP